MASTPFPCHCWLVVDNIHPSLAVLCHAQASGDIWGVTRLDLFEPHPQAEVSAPPIDIVAVA
jgi:hypothetical protein